MKIYTKTGDGGTSALFTGDRFPKNHTIFEALGAVDETNAAIGIAREFVHKINERHKLDEWLEEIQSRLFDVGAVLATPRLDTTRSSKIAKTTFPWTKNVSNLERWIDEMDANLPPLTQFVLPGGGEASAFLHSARAICRRAERASASVRAAASVETTDDDRGAFVYLNRLSDFLFVAARYVAHIEGKRDMFWKKK